MSAAVLHVRAVQVQQSPHPLTCGGGGGAVSEPPGGVVATVNYRLLRSVWSGRPCRLCAAGVGSHQGSVDVKHGGGGDGVFASWSRQCFPLQSVVPRHRLDNSSGRGRNLRLGALTDRCPRISRPSSAESDVGQIGPTGTSLTTLRSTSARLGRRRPEMHGHWPECAL